MIDLPKPVARIPASPGFDALWLDSETLAITRAPVIAWELFDDDDPTAVTPWGADYAALRFPDGHVLAIDQIFSSTNAWIDWIKSRKD